jgi:Tfp pilus assembly protein PilV
MIRLTSQRGVSLLVLITMVTVFAGVAIGFVTLVRSRHESYPYQVQSYQAYALAHAGAAFAMRYALDNNDFMANPGKYVANGIAYNSANWKTFQLGSDSFKLQYVTGSCNDRMYARGECGTATREVVLQYFSTTLGAGGKGVYLQAGANIHARNDNDYCPSTTLCAVDVSALCNNVDDSDWTGGTVLRDTLRMASTAPLTLARLRIGDTAGIQPQYVYDEFCQSGYPSGTGYPVGGWDGVTLPPPAPVTIPWNIHDPYPAPHGSDRVGSGIAAWKAVHTDYCAIGGPPMSVAGFETNRLMIFSFHSGVPDGTRVWVQFDYSKNAITYTSTLVFMVRNP